MKLKQVICPCNKLTQLDIVQAIADGAESLKAIKRQTGAMSKCGKCKPRVKQLIQTIEQTTYRK